MRENEKYTDLTYKPIFTDEGEQYGTLYLGDRIIASGVQESDAREIQERFNNNKPRKK